MFEFPNLGFKISRYEKVKLIKGILLYVLISKELDNILLLNEEEHFGLERKCVIIGKSCHVQCAYWLV